MSPPIQMRFILSGDDMKRLPPTTREIALVGRSNVGKSSLVNAIGNRKNLAHVSKTPGRTQLLNIFEVEPGATIVDCPGYGYASAPGSVRARWQPMIEGYLLGRDELEAIVVLVDGEIGPTKLDLQMLDWLRSYGRPIAIVATKHDKVKSSQRIRRKRDLAAGCGVEPGDVIWVSAAKGVGIDRLRSAIRGWLALS
jgi:GTP-binding protein